MRTRGPNRRIKTQVLYPNSSGKNYQQNNEDSDKDPGEPMKFPDYYRREEEDRFDVYVKYSVEHRKIFWWAHRMSNRQDKDSISRTRGGQVQLWGYYFPYCENIEQEAECQVLEKANKNTEKLEIMTVDGKTLTCNDTNFGMAILEGSCKINRNLYDIINYKKQQGYRLVFNYNPDTKIKDKILEYANNTNNTNNTNIYKPSNDIFSYIVQSDVLNMLGQKFVCDIIMSFSKLIKDNPGGMKMKFDYITTECPNPIEKCSPYMYPNGPETTRDVTINDMANDWISLNKGKGCDVLIHGDSTVPQRRRGHYYKTETQYFPPYKYVASEGTYEPMNKNELIQAIKDAKRSNRLLTQEEQEEIEARRKIMSQRFQ